MKEKYAIYIRVSTQKQGHSGLGLQAQQDICENYINTQHGEIMQQFCDVMSGTKRDRPELLKAIDYCKQNKCILVFAKLDRLARDVEFTFKVINTGIEVHFCDMPVVNTMLLGVFSSVAQYERELCSARTKQALAVKKEQGCKLGRANKNYAISPEHEKARIDAIARKKNANTLLSADFQSFCRIMKRIYPILSDYATPEPLFFLRWPEVAKSISRTNENIKSILSLMRDAKMDNPNLFSKINLDSPDATLIIKNKINSVFCSIRNFNKINKK